MGRFNIDGAWYDAPSYAEARKLAAQAKTGAGPTPKGAPAPAYVPPTLGARQVVVPAVQNVALPAVQKSVKPPAPKFIPAVKSSPGAQSFDMRCYRGEKNNWWSPPEERLICGMTLYQPWNLQVGIGSMPALWEHLRKFIQENCFGKVDAFTQYLRAQGRPFALATARTTSGSYTSDYNYTIKISNARTFLWGPKLTLGPQVAFKEVADVTADYIVLNADTIEASTILAVGHKCGTYEVTFLHDLGIVNIESINNKPLDTSAIKSQNDLAFDEKIKLRKYLRHGTSWLG